VDWVVVAIYFLLVFGVAIWATLRERAAHATSQDYFLAGRHAGWFIVGASLFASNIGSEHLNTWSVWREPAPPAAWPWRSSRSSPR
jgi:SSS family solute:Na+ symporter